MEETISLQEIFATLKKRMLMIAAIAILATVASAVVSYFFITPIYQSSTQILVNQSKSDNNQLNVGEIQTNVQMINTYSVVIKSPRILDKVIKELDLDTTADALAEKMTVQSAQNSQVFTLSVQDADPALAVKIANTTANVFEKQVPTIMNVDNVTVLSPAVLKETPQPIKPKPTLNMAIALVVGLMIGVGLAFLLEYLDNTVKLEQDIEQLLELPVLGAISEINPNEQKNFEKQLMRQARGETLES